MRTKRTLVCGVGRNDFEGSIKANGKLIPEYIRWTAMLQRCYSSELQERMPTYNGCSVAPEWHSFNNFRNWLITQPNWNVDGFEVDKDLLCESNKVYCPEFCRIIPLAINSLFGDRGASRGTYPIGVSKDKAKYKASVSTKNGRLNLGRFNAPEEAHQVYMIAKAVYANHVVQDYKPSLPEDVYQVLIQRTKDQYAKYYDPKYQHIIDTKLFPKLYEVKAA